MKKQVLLGGLALIWTTAGAPAGAIDGISVEAGSGDGTDMGRIGVQRDWKTRWFQGQNWHLGGYWDLAVGYWHRSAPPGFNDDITEIGLTPVFRLQQNDLRGPYLEGAIGFHLLSRTSLGDKRFSTQFQFGDHLGLGVRFGPGGRYDFGYRFQHLSNAGIKKPNNGIEFHQIRFQYRF
ncbi:MAG: acyloxyacyl hydrolase [Betaproteobacteria bacterium]|nr:acyloxyacyl hydrolase [Betaproteobacteria bacterium]